MEYIILDNEWHTPYCKINGKSINELIEIARIYSCEIEYSDENINRLLSELG